MNKDFLPHPASYRDPAGFIFYHNQQLYRQVSQSFRQHFDHFINSGAGTAFIQEGLLIPHERIDNNLSGSPDWYTTIKPATVPFISYPWEWSFNMLQDAALLTLRLAKRSIEYGLILKDATPLNVQWYQGRMVFIDTLSFERYDATQPWIAYRQFCEMFLSPLLLMHYTGRPLQPLLLAWPDGIPLLTARQLLPWRSKFNMGVFLHIHLHGKMAERQQATKQPGKYRTADQPYAATGTDQPTGKSGVSAAARHAGNGFSKQKMLNQLDNLKALVKGLRSGNGKSNWSGYYEEAATRTGYLENKKQLIGEWLALLPGVKTVADLGSNEGEFAMIAAAAGKQVIAADLDAFCIDRLYKRIRSEDVNNVQPLVLDFSQPSPAAGFAGREYSSFTDRCRVDLVMALALIHHLCIGKSLPAEQVAEYFSRICRQLVIEFVPPHDEKVLVLLSQKSRSFPAYNEQSVKAAFSVYFDLVKQSPVGGSDRQLWLLKKKQA